MSLTTKTVLNALEREYAFGGMPSDFLIEDWNKFPCPYGPKWDKRVPLPPEISLLLPQHGIVPGQPSALGLAYAGVKETRRT